MKTLADTLKAIGIEPNVEIGLLKTILEEWRKKNYLVDRVIRRETTFSGENRNVTEKLRGWRLYLPNYVSEKNLSKKDIAALEEAIGELPNEKWTTLMDNPISWPIGMYPLMFGAIYGCSKLVGADKEISRREFMFETAERAGIYSVLSFISGITGIRMRHKALGLAEDNAEYLDKIIKEVYKADK